MSTLLTGAGGFVGARLGRRLLADQIAVRALVRSVSGARAASMAEIQVAEPWETADFAPALAGVSTVFHLAARVHVMHETEPDAAAAFHRFNVAATMNLARQAAAAGVQRFVFVSSVKVNGEQTLAGRPFVESDAAAPQDDYSRSKMLAETQLRELAVTTGMAVVIVRPPLVYGPGAKGNFAALAKAVLRGMPLPLGSINNRRSLVALDNLVDFLVTVGSHPLAINQTFLVSDGDDLSTTQLVRGIASAAAMPVRLIPVPPWLLRVAGAIVGRTGAVQRLCGDLQVDIGKAERLLGWRPPLSVQQGLRRAVTQGQADEKSV